AFFILWRGYQPVDNIPPVRAQLQSADAFILYIDLSEFFWLKFLLLRRICFSLLLVLFYDIKKLQLLVFQPFFLLVAGRQITLPVPSSIGCRRITTRACEIG